MRNIVSIPRYIHLALLLIALPAFANDPPAPTPQQQEQLQDQSQNQANAQTQTVTAGGGQGGGASNQLSIGGDRALALANGAQHTPQCPNGLVPGRGKNRAHGSPVYAISGVCVAPDESQAAAIDAARAHELALARLAIEAAHAQAEASREAARRIEAESSCQVCLGK